MNAFVLIVLLLTSDGPKVLRVEYEGRGRSCQLAATQLSLQTPRMAGGRVLYAECVREFET